MAVPSKTFTIIADSAIDADSPLTADLMEDFRNNDIFLEEWLGHSYVAAQDHDHDGVNSALIAESGAVYKIADETVTNSTVAQHDDDLFFSVIAGSFYSWEMVLIMSSSAPPDFKFNVSILGTITCPTYNYTVADMSTAGITSYTADYHNDISVTTANVGIYVIRMSGLFSTTNTTYFQLKWAQNTSSANDTKVKISSYLVYKKVG